MKYKASQFLVFLDSWNLENLLCQVQVPPSTHYTILGNMVLREFFLSKRGAAGAVQHRNASDVEEYFHQHHMFCQHEPGVNTLS